MHVGSWCIYKPYQFFFSINRYLCDNNILHCILAILYAEFLTVLVRKALELGSFGTRLPMLRPNPIIRIMRPALEFPVILPDEVRVPVQDPQVVHRSVLACLPSLR